MREFDRLLHKSWKQCDGALGANAIISEAAKSEKKMREPCHTVMIIIIIPHFHSYALKVTFFNSEAHYKIGVTEHGIKLS